MKKLLFFSTLLLAIAACTNDELDPIVPNPDGCASTAYTYNDQIQSIINTKCATPECHGGAAPGEYTTYDGMFNRLESGLIQNRVLIQRDMPEPPFTLTPEEFTAISCWIEQGYPEN